MLSQVYLIFLKIVINFVLFYINEIYQFNDLEEFIIDKYNYSNVACPNYGYLNEKIIEKRTEYLDKHYPNLISFEIIFNEYND